MNTYGRVLKHITIDGNQRKYVGEKLYYEVAVIDDGGIECLYIRVTNERYDDEHPERYGTHFNVEWVEERHRSWLGMIIGNAMAEAVKQSNDRTYTEIKRRTNDLLQAFETKTFFK